MANRTGRSQEEIAVEWVRDQFPSLSRTLPDGRPVVFFDGPGGSQPPQRVIDAVATHLGSSMANLDGAFVTAQETDRIVEHARQAAADLVGATPAEIAFGANMTTLNFQLAHAVARTFEPGDEIIVTALDHDANVSPWLTVADDHRLSVRAAPIHTADGTLDVDTLEEMIGPRTRVVAFPLASNALGTVPDARRIATAAHRAGALAWADAVHFAPHRRINRDVQGLDVLLCSPYKFFGAHLGLAAIRRDLAETLPADKARPAGDDPPGHRFETGTQSHEALAGLTAAVDYLAGLGEGADRSAQLDDAYARIQRYESKLTARFLAGLRTIPGVTLYGIGDQDRIGERTPTFCFRLEGMTPRELSEALAADGIFTWDGHYYAIAVMDSLGLSEDGAVRVGFLHYNTADEVDRCLDALRHLST